MLSRVSVTFFTNDLLSLNTLHVFLDMRDLLAILSCAPLSQWILNLCLEPSVLLEELQSARNAASECHISVKAANTQGKG